MKTSPYSDLSSKDVLIRCYHGVFAFIFWFVLFGPVGLALYMCIYQLTLTPDDDATFKVASEKALTILDWVPVKLLGLSFALVGSFGQVFVQWIKDIAHVKDIAAQLERWAFLAATGSKKETDVEQPIQMDKDALIGLLNRSLVVWLVVVALICVGMIVG